MNRSKLLTFERFIKLKVKQKILESSSHQYEYGCVMIYFDLPVLNIIHSIIKEDDIYSENDDDQRYGLENEPHVTLLYGIHSDEVKDDRVIKILNSFKSQIKNVKLKNISVFENEKYDVLKFDAEAEFLYKINKKLSSDLPYSTDYPDYHPHLTIGYLKPKMGQKYINLFKNMEINLKPIKFVYSKPDGDKIQLTI